MTQKDIEIILLRQWASLMATPIWVADNQGDLVFYNEPAEQILGVRFDEAGEMPVERHAAIFEVRDDDGSPMKAEDTPLGIALAAHHASHKRLRYRALDCVWHRAEVTAFPLEGQGGRHMGAVAIFWKIGEDE